MLHYNSFGADHARTLYGYHSHIERWLREMLEQHAMVIIILFLVYQYT